MKSSILEQYRDQSLIDFKSSCVQHPHFKAAIAFLKKALCFSGDHEFESVAITGPTGVGKSTVCRVFKQQLQSQIPSNSDELPVIYITTKTITTPKSFYSNLLHELGALKPDFGTADLMRTRLKTLLVERGVIVIILDEFQDLFECKATTEAVRTANFYKGFMKEMKIPIVISGTEEVANLFKINRQFRRLYNVYELPNLNMNSPQSSEYFRIFIQHLMKNCPMHVAVEFRGIDLERLYLATEGSIAMVKKLATEALLVAKENEAEALELSAFSSAFSTYFRYRYKEIGINPFNAKKPEIKALMRRAVK